MPTYVFYALAADDVCVSTNINDFSFAQSGPADVIDVANSSDPIAVNFDGSFYKIAHVIWPFRSNSLASASIVSAQLEFTGFGVPTGSGTIVVKYDPDFEKLAGAFFSWMTPTQGTAAKTACSVPYTTGVGLGRVSVALSNLSGIEKGRETTLRCLLQYYLDGTTPTGTNQASVVMTDNAGTADDPALTIVAIGGAHQTDYQRHQKPSISRRALRLI